MSLFVRVPAFDQRLKAAIVAVRSLNRTARRLPFQLGHVPASGEADEVGR